MHSPVGASPAGDLGTVDTDVWEILADRLQGRLLQSVGSSQVLVNCSFRLQASSYNQWFSPRLSRSQLAYQKIAELFRTHEFRVATKTNVILKFS